MTEDPTVTESPGGGGGDGGSTGGGSGGASKECDGSAGIAMIEGDCNAFMQCTGVGKGVKIPCPGESDLGQGGGVLLREVMVRSGVIEYQKKKQIVESAILIVMLYLMTYRLGFRWSFVQSLGVDLRLARQCQERRLQINNFFVL